MTVLTSPVPGVNRHTLRTCPPVVGALLDGGYGCGLQNSSDCGTVPGMADLIVNEPRIGWFVYGRLPDGSMPHIPAMLVDNGSSIRLTVPWQSESPTSQLERWFGGNGVHYADDPSRTKYSYEFPGQVGFLDADGPIVLIGCRAFGWKDAIGLGVGRGLAIASLAVIGGEITNYDKVHAVRTFLPEFGEWMGLSSIDNQETIGSTGRLVQLDLRLALKQPLKLARRMNLQAVPSWRVQRDQYGPQQLHDESFIETRTKQPKDWQEHLALHQSIRELLDIAGWEPFGFGRIILQRVDDPIHALDGSVLEERWCNARTYSTRSPRSSKNHPRYIFRFEDIGTRGVSRWLALRDKFQRGVMPILSLLDDSEANFQARLAQSALGLEAIGYELAIEGGMSIGAAKNLSFFERMTLIRDMLPVPTVHSSWPRRASDAYNGIKHANRPLPVPVDMWSVIQENCLVFRVWVASRLGAKAERLKSGLNIDPARLNLNQIGLPAE